MTVVEITLISCFMPVAQFIKFFSVVAPQTILPVLRL